jgi:hypothetical protein
MTERRGDRSTPPDRSGALRDHRRPIIRPDGGPDGSRWGQPPTRRVSDGADGATARAHVIRSPGPIRPRALAAGQVADRSVCPGRGVPADGPVHLLPPPVCGGPQPGLLDHPLPDDHDDGAGKHRVGSSACRDPGKHGLPADAAADLHHAHRGVRVRREPHSARTDDGRLRDRADGADPVAAGGAGDHHPARDRGGLSDHPAGHLGP